jgi:hypothetical protein
MVLESGRCGGRELMWFWNEPNLHWIYGAGERANTAEEVSGMLAAMETDGDATNT